LSYDIPRKAVIDEYIIKKSRFITHIQRAQDKQAALAFIATIKNQYPDARHHCWAYIAGHPTETIAIASSDDGEPQGTAGKPMLNVLQHQNIGEIVMVIVRYFGGIKLGAGGLVRAYSHAANQAMTLLETELLTTKKALRLRFDYTLEKRVVHFCTEHQITIVETTYAERINMMIEVDEKEASAVEVQLHDLTSGKMTVL